MNDRQIVKLQDTVTTLEFLRRREKNAYRKLQQACSKKDVAIRTLTFRLKVKLAASDTVTIESFESLERVSIKCQNDRDVLTKRLADSAMEVERLRAWCNTKDFAITALTAERDKLDAVERGSKTAERVAFVSGWQNATGHYSGKQVWDLERCWEQHQRDGDVGNKERMK